MWWQRRFGQQTVIDSAIFSVTLQIISRWSNAFSLTAAPVFRSFPFGLTDNASLRRQDYRVLIDEISDKANAKTTRDEVWTAFGRSARRQGRLLSWYYFFIVSEAIGFGYLAKNYGKYQQDSPKYRWIADTFLLPNISES